MCVFREWEKSYTNKIVTFSHNLNTLYDNIIYFSRNSSCFENLYNLYKMTLFTVHLYTRSPIYRFVYSIHIGTMRRSQNFALVFVRIQNAHSSTYKIHTHTIQPSNFMIFASNFMSGNDNQQTTFTHSKTSTYRSCFYSSKNIKWNLNRIHCHFECMIFKY